MRTTARQRLDFETGHIVTRILGQDHADGRAVPIGNLSQAAELRIAQLPLEDRREIGYPTSPRYESAVRHFVASWSYRVVMS